MLENRNFYFLFVKKILSKSHVTYKGFPEQLFEKICYQPIDFNINCLKFQIHLKQTFEKSGKYYFTQKVLFKKVEGQKRATF